MESGLILSAGMPRAGSGWHYNLIHDLVVASGGLDAHSIRKKYRLQRILTEVNCNISTLRISRLLPVMIPTLMGNKYAIKTHAGPTQITRLLIKLGVIRVAYIFRDPRAAMLSAYEYGQRHNVTGRRNAFSQLTTLDSAAEFIRFYVQIWDKWSATEGVLIVKYEHLVDNFDVEIQHLMEFLSLDPTKDLYHPILDKHRPEMGNQRREGTHFNKGQIERFKYELNPSQLDKYSSMFKSALEEMGYSI